MPKGQVIVNWKEGSNNERLLVAIAKVHNIDAAAVAKAFGPDVPAACITRRLTALRSQFKADVGSPAKAGRSPSKSTAGHNGTGKKAGSSGEKAGSKRKAFTLDEDDEDNDEEEMHVVKSENGDDGEEGEESDETVRHEYGQKSKNTIKSEYYGGDLE